ncbi:hypothetical protein IPJ72_05500 [Candidatus Peregrinibacteria bacterium]|nr:MAG: hypothetical protein IPJ72_05500 [Candidatus Peregrinibacteria bacterium]
MHASTIRAMQIIYVIYVALIATFVFTTSLIIRHMVRFSYLSNRFRKVVLGFVVLAAIVIVFSLYLVFNLVALDAGGLSTPSIPNTGGINF